MSIAGMRKVPGTSLYIPKDMETIGWRDLRDEDGKPVERGNPDLVRVMDGLGISYEDFKDFHVDSFLKIESSLDMAQFFDRQGQDLRAWSLTQQAKQFAHHAKAFDHSVPALKIVPQYQIIPGSGRLYRDEDEDGKIGDKGERKFNKAELAELEKLGVEPSELEGMTFKQARLFLTSVHNIKGAKTLSAKIEAYDRAIYHMGELERAVKPFVDAKVSDQFKEMCAESMITSKELVEHLDIASSADDFVDAAQLLESIEASSFRVASDTEIDDLKDILRRKAGLFAMSEVEDAANARGSKGAVRQFSYLIEDFSESKLTKEIAMRVKPLLGRYRAAISIARRLDGADQDLMSALKKKGVTDLNSLALRISFEFEDMADELGIDTDADFFTDLLDSIKYRLKRAERKGRKKRGDPVSA